jgi:hypothetical protein
MLHAEKTRLIDVFELSGYLSGYVIAEKLMLISDLGVKQRNLHSSDQNPGLPPPSYRRLRQGLLYLLCSACVVTPAWSATVYDQTVRVQGNTHIKNNERVVYDIMPGDRVSLDPATGTVNFNVNSTGTGCDPQPGCTYVVDADGLSRAVYDDPGNQLLCYNCDCSCADPMSSSPHAGLFMRIGANFTFIGRRVNPYNFTATVDNTLKLGVNDCVSTPNSGYFDVPVTINRPTVTVNDISVNENAGTATFTIILDIAPPANPSVPVTVFYSTANGTALATSDYTALVDDSVTFAAGQTSKTVAVTLVNDTRDENNQTFSLNLTSITNAAIGDAQAIATILDDDAAPTVQFALASSSGSESSSSANLSVNLSAASEFTVTVPFSLSGTATNGVEYSASASPLTFNPGDTSESVTLSITNDALDEDNETVVVTLGTPINATLGANAAHTYTINDDDASPTVQFALASSSAGESTATANLSVNLSAASGRTITAPFTLSGTATNGPDYAATASPLTFASGQTSKNVTLTISNDALDENNETVIVTLGTPVNATLGANTTHTYTINDDDAPPTVQLALTSSSGTESSATVNMVVNLSAASGLTVTTPFTLSGTATNGPDYSATASPLTFTTGQTSKNVTLTVSGDTLDEDNETVIVTLGTPVNATLGATTVHTYTINDDDLPPTIQFALASSSAAESTATANLAVNLSAASGRTITAPFTLSGTATNGPDYSATVSPLTFTNAQTSKNVTLTITNDSLDEDNETVSVSLGTPVNATLGGSTLHTYTINDDDPAPSLSINDTTVSEKDLGTTNAVLTVLLSALSGKTITVDWASANGTAIAPYDYATGNGTLTFNPGTLQINITRAVTNDVEDEVDEVFYINLSNPFNASLGDAQGLITIMDNDVTILLKDLNFMPASGVATMTWATVVGKTYQLFASSNLLATNWVQVGSNIIAAGTNAAATEASTDSLRFYRIKQISP